MGVVLAVCGANGRGYSSGGKGCASVHRLLALLCEYADSVTNAQTLGTYSP